MNTTDSITIHELTALTPEIATSVRHLASLLGEGHEPLGDDDLKRLIASETTSIIIATDTTTNTVIGMITLVVYRIPYKLKGWMEDLVVEEAYRGKGVATRLIEKTISFARTRGIQSLDFTSQPTRESANKLYQRLGFQKKETNVYRMLLS